MGRETEWPGIKPDEVNGLIIPDGYRLHLVYCPYCGNPVYFIFPADRFIHGPHKIDGLGCFYEKTREGWYEVLIRCPHSHPRYQSGDGFFHLNWDYLVNWDYLARVDRRR